MKLNFKNRIAFHYMIATAVIMAVVFGIVYIIVKKTVFQNLDKELSFEARKHSKEIKIVEDSIVFINKREWEETEHTEIQVKPVFIQLVNQHGRITDKSPNLKLDYLTFQALENGINHNTTISSQRIRQIQLPVRQNDEIKGYILAGISSESAESLIDKLRSVLIISFITVLIGLYFISRFLAGRSILPVSQMTNTIQRITKNNLNDRVALPQNKDEIYELSEGFNALLERIESALARERQFTSDASHELRTPLASLRGTLEVLIRKERSPEEYHEKIEFSLSEIDKMTLTIEQLLQLARIDEQNGAVYENSATLSEVIDKCILKLKKEIELKEINITISNNYKLNTTISEFYSKLILKNILSNAVKYSHIGGNISIIILDDNGRLRCSIQDEGIGINQDDLDKIFNNFYRSDAMNHRDIEGNGLGLSIVKKSAQAINAEVQITSSLGQGTTVSVLF